MCPADLDRCPPYETSSEGMEPDYSDLYNVEKEVAKVDGRRRKQAYLQLLQVQAAKEEELHLQNDLRGQGKDRRCARRGRGSVRPSHGTDGHSGQEAQAVVGSVGGWAPHTLEEGVMWRLACGRSGSRCVLRSGMHGKHIRVSGKTVSHDWRKRFGDLGVASDSLWVLVW